MRRAIQLGLGAVVLVASAAAQVRGVPASATSIRVGNPVPGIGASVSSLGPAGFTTASSFRFDPVRRHSRLHRDFVTLPTAIPFFSYIPAVQVVLVQPEAPPVEVREREPQRIEVVLKDERPTASEEREAAPVPVPIAKEDKIEELPVTTIILRDGSRRELRNFAIMTDGLYDLADARRIFRIELGAIDRDATNRLNAANGRDFRLP